MRTPPENAVKIGAHYFWLEGDLAITVIDGNMSAEEVVAMQQVSKPISDQCGYVLSLVDASRAGTVTPEARRVSADYQRKNPVPGAVGVFGTGVMLRAINALYSRAISLLTTTPREMALFKTEAEARLWLESQRLRLRKIIGSSHTP